jgi:hypothetical protein
MELAPGKPGAFSLLTLFSGMRAELAVPIVRTPDGQESLTIILESAFQAEARAPEVAAVTPAKAPELLVTFNKAYLDLTQIFAQLHLQRSRAEDALGKAKAVVLLDKLPGILKTKNVSSSVDIRQAIVDTDPDYQKAKECLDVIEATMEYIKGKIKFMENSYTAVKKIIGEKNWNMAGDGASRALSSGEVGGTVGRPQFGKPL